MLYAEPNSRVIDELKDKLCLHKSLTKNAHITCNGRTINKYTTFARNNIHNNDNIQILCKLVGGMKNNRKTKTPLNI